VPAPASLLKVNTPALMKGYLGRNDLTSKVVIDGWFSTGDMGFIDEHGRLHLRGRVRDEINKSGQKIYPGDIDAVIEQFDQTVDVCAFAVPDPLHGEDVGVAVVLQAPDVLDRLYEWTSERLGSHQVPQRWYLVSEIPRTPRGKVNRQRVAEVCESLSPAAVAGLRRAPMSK
jgi:acyl-CoA synthetase (AMP-forming)/AMP-acid ligase II